ncbi:MAG: acetyltransferase [Thiohalophilus sp.]|jgi:hypothetical protein
MKDEKRQIAENVRRACLQAAQEAYEQAGISGLCGEGRWEIAMDAIRQLDINKLIDEPQDATGSSQDK